MALALRALPDIDALGEPEWPIELRNTLTMAYHNQGLAGDALPHALEALQRARRLGQARLLGWCMNRLAIVHEALGDSDHALACLHEAVEHAEADGDAELRFSCHINLARTSSLTADRELDAGHDEAARAWAQRALAAVRRAASLAGDNTVRQLFSWGIEAATLDNLGDAAAMSERLERHQVLAAQAQLPHFLLVGDMMRARVLGHQGRPEAAWQLLDSLQERQRLHGDENSLRQWLLARWKIGKACGRFDAALAALEEVRRMEQHDAQQRIAAQGRQLLREAEVAQARQETERLRREATLATAASLRDALTGLSNRRALDSRLHAGFAPGNQPPQAAALLDIDRFKRINDTLGHEAGDRVLRELARLLQTSAGDDCVFRQGGEEFAMLLDDATAAAALCEALREQVERHDWSALLPAMGGVTISVGLARTTAGDDGASLMRRADRALYRAKEGGRNRLVVSGD